MKMKIYENKMFEGRRKSPSSKQWILNANLNWGTLTFNPALTEALGIEDGFRVMVAEDEDTGRLYLSFGAGIDCRSSYKCRLTQDDRRGRFCCRSLATKLVETAGGERGASFALSRKPVMKEGREWYCILTKRPVWVG